MIYSVCVNPERKQYVAFLRDQPDVMATGSSHAEAVGNLVIEGKLVDPLGVEHTYINED